MRKVTGTLAVAVVLAAALAACGSSSQELSPAEFRTQADAVCRSAQTRMERIGSEGGPRQATLRRIAAVLDSALDRLDAIDPPSRLSDDYERLLGDLAEQRDFAAEGAGASEDATPAEQRANNDRIHRIAETQQALGLSECG